MKSQLFLTATVLVLATSLVNAELISTSMVVDDIEYYIQVDDSVYDLGEDVEMLFRVTNLGEEDVTISCSRTPEFNSWVEQDEETAWTQIEGWFWSSPGIEILAGEFEERIYTWDMIGDNENLVGIGTYNVLGVMYNEPWNDYYYETPIPTEVAVEITIVPEPATFLLLGLGLYGIRRIRS